MQPSASPTTWSNFNICSILHMFIIIYIPRTHRYSMILYVYINMMIILYYVYTIRFLVRVWSLLTWCYCTIVNPCPANRFFRSIPRHAPLGRDFGQAPTPPRCHLYIHLSFNHWFNHDSRIWSEAPALGFSCPDWSFRGPGSEATLEAHIYMTPLRTCSQNFT